jgi:hypothetical protein
MRTYKTAFLVGIVFAVMPSLGQSLGDVARQQKQKQQAKDAKAAPKVITNEDLPAHSESDSSAASKGKEKSGNSQNQADDHLPRLGSPSDPTAAEHWKAVIRAQKSVIESMQSEIDKLNDSIHFVEANRYSNGVEYNQYQLRKKQEAERLQKQLEAENKKLEDMQESARKAGFGSAVYDP